MLIYEGFSDLLLSGFRFCDSSSSVRSHPSSCTQRERETKRVRCVYEFICQTLFFQMPLVVNNIPRGRSHFIHLHPPSPPVFNPHVFQITQ